MSRSVLVTGGAGFIGRRLAGALAAAGDRVTVIDSFVTDVHGRRADARLADGIAVVRGDVRDRAVTWPLVDRADVVFHMAALTGMGQSMYEVRHYLDVNVCGTAVLLEALARGGGERRLVLPSSRAVYGEGAYRCADCGTVRPVARSKDDLAVGRWEPRCPRCAGDVTAVPTAEDCPDGPATSIYALTKHTQERTASIVAEAYGVPVAILRYFNVYGPGQSLLNPYTGVVAAFVTSVLAGRAPSVFEDGRESRDFVHVDDVVRATIAAGERPEAAGCTCNVGSATALGMLEVAAVVSEALGGERPTVTGQFRIGDVRHCTADLTRARDVLGYEPRVDARAGLADTARALAEQEWVDLSDVAHAALRERGLADAR